MDNSLIAASAAKAAAYDLVTVRSNAKAFPRLHQLTRAQAVTQLTPCILQAYMYRGQNADSTLVEFTTGNLVDELMADTDKLGLRQLTVYEISRAVKRAVLGQSGKEMYGVNVASLYEVLADYAKGEGHLADAAAKEALKKAGQSRSVSALIDTMTGAMVKHSNPYKK